MRRSELSEQDLPARRPVGGFKGGVVYAAELDGKLYLIEDESTLREFISPEECQGLDFVRVYEFESEAEREHYIEILCRPAPWRCGASLETVPAMSHSERKPDPGRNRRSHGAE